MERHYHALPPRLLGDYRFTATNGHPLLLISADSRQHAARQAAIIANTVRRGWHRRQG
jgi:hypothetical protein